MTGLVARFELLAVWRDRSVRSAFVLFVLVVSASGLWSSVAFLERSLVGGVETGRPDAARLWLGLAIVCSLWVSWTVCRMMYRDRGDELVRRSVVSAISPTRAVFAKVLALLILVGALLAMTLPVAMIAYSVGMMSAADLIDGSMRLFALLAAAGLVAMHFNLTSASRLGPLALSLLAGLALAVFSYSAGPTLGRAAADGTLLAVCGAAAVGLGYRCRARLVYLAN